jgi:hypothetical protein
VVVKEESRASLNEYRNRSADSRQVRTVRKSSPSLGHSLCRACRGHRLASRRSDFHLDRCDVDSGSDQPFAHIARNVHATAISGLYIAYRRLNQADPLASAAIEIEKGQPELRDQLLSAVELARDGEASGSVSFIGALQQNVAGKIRSVDVRSLLPLKLLSKPIAVVSGIVLICILLAAFPQLQFGRRFARAIIPGFDIDRVSRTQIVIERPTPASCSVPANEIVAIVIHLEGELDDEATLQWRSDDGGRGKVSMSVTNSLVAADASAEQPTFAANLQVNEAPVEYRITAGDGVTRWQRLKPQSRPQATEFISKLSPPEYTKLPESTNTSRDGHLKGARRHSCQPAC